MGASTDELDELDELDALDAMWGGAVAAGSCEDRTGASDALVTDLSRAASEALAGGAATSFGGTEDNFTRRTV